VLRDPSLIPLSHQHHNGLALCVLTERALKEDTPAEPVARLAQRIVDRYEIELTNHFEIEEQILFPAMPSALAAELTAEHRDLERLVEALRSRPSRELILEFTGLLRRHIRREENEYFEIIQKEVPRADLDEIGAAIDRKVVRVCL
jgi:hemerythrin-like domain-containing protein